MYVQPRPLSPATSPCATASGSTATAAIGQIVAMNVGDVHLLAEVPRRGDVRDEEQHRDTPNTLPSSDASPLGGALSSTSATPPKATSAKTSARGSMCSPEQPRPDRHDEERRERPDERGVGDAVVRRAGEEHGEVEPEEDAGDQRLPHVGAS